RAAQLPRPPPGATLRSALPGPFGDLDTASARRGNCIYRRRPRARLNRPRRARRRDHLTPKAELCPRTISCLLTATPSGVLRRARQAARGPPLCAQLYRKYEQAAKRLQDDGARIWRVVIDVELKRQKGHASDQLVASTLEQPESRQV